MPITHISSMQKNTQSATPLALSLAQRIIEGDESASAVKKWARASGHPVSKLSTEEIFALWRDYSGLSTVNSEPLNALEPLEPVAIPQQQPATQPHHNANQEPEPMTTHMQPAPTPTPTVDTQKLESAMATLMQAMQQPAAPATPAITQEQIIALIHQHAEKPNLIEIVNPIDPAKPTKKLGMQHHAFGCLLAVAGQRKNAYLCGPAGSGKTTAARKVAEAIDLPFYSHGALGSAHQLLGYMDGNGVYQRTTFREAFEFGGVFLWDEIDGSIPGEAIAVNDALACEAGAPTSFPDGMVTRHADFVAIGAANTIGNGASRQYVGRYQLDGATLNRFAHIEWDYDNKLEKHAAGNAEWVAIVQQYRKAIDKLNMQHIVSPRDSINGAQMLASGMDLKTVKQLYLYRGMSRDEIKRIDEAVGE